MAYLVVGFGEGGEGECFSFVSFTYHIVGMFRWVLLESSHPRLPNSRNLQELLNTFVNILNYIFCESLLDSMGLV